MNASQRRSDEAARLAEKMVREIGSTDATDKRDSELTVAYLLPFTVALLEAREALRANEWGFNHRRCVVCAGWNVGPNGETDHAHTKDCKVATALATLSALIEVKE